MKLKGMVHKFGDDLDTDVIIPARYLNTTERKILAEHCMEGVAPGFHRKVKKGDIMVAGKNFGSGSSREHAPIALKAAGIGLVIARNFARIFYRNAFNTGLPLLESEEAAKGTRAGDRLEVELETGVITNLRTGRKFFAAPVPEFMLELVKDGGLVRHLQRKAGRRK